MAIMEKKPNILLIRSAVFAVAFLGVGMTDPYAAEPAKIESANLRIPILLSKPEGLATPIWPVTVGIPFKKGEVRGRKIEDGGLRIEDKGQEVSDLTIVGEDGKPVPCQIIKTADWVDFHFSDF